MNKKELVKIKEKALKENIPIIMDDTLKIVGDLLNKINPKTMLEIGTAVGYSAICFSSYIAEGGFIDTIERDTERVKEAKININKLVTQVFPEYWGSIPGPEHVGQTAATRT